MRQKQKTAESDRDALLAKLKDYVRNTGDPEEAHIDADEALLDYIGDDEIRAAFEAIEKWYA